MNINVMTIEQEQALRTRWEHSREAGRTLAQVADDIFRIDHPQTNAALTRSGGLASPTLLKHLFQAVGTEQDFGADITFRRGNNSKRWYFQITRGE